MVAAEDAKVLPSSWIEAGSLCAALEQLPLRERGRAMAVCRTWRSEASRVSLWKVLDARLFFSAYRDVACERLRATLSSPRFSAVEEVNFECCKKVGDPEVAMVPPAHLRRLNLNALHGVSAAAIEALVSQCGRLERLSLFWLPRLPDSALVAVARGCPGLTALNLSGCLAMTDEGMDALLAKCTKLTDLDITRCPQLTDAALRRIAETLGRSLVDLNCYANSNFSDEGYGALAISATRLERLDVCGARLLSSAALAAVAAGCGASLTSLNCSWCTDLDDAAGVALARHCKRLKFLSFHGILAITDATIDALSKSPAGRTLETLDVSGCARVTDYRRGAGTLQAKFPNVTCWVAHR